MIKIVKRIFRTVCYSLKIQIMGISKDHFWWGCEDQVWIIPMVWDIRDDILQLIYVLRLTGSSAHLKPPPACSYNCFVELGNSVL